MSKIEEKNNLANLPESVLKEHLKLTERLKEIDRVETCQNDFLSFVKSQWPSFIEGPHHVKMAKAFDRIAEGKVKRLIINMPPRHTKSEFASHYFPAYLVGRNPSLKILQATHTADLAVKFGRKIRDLMMTDDFEKVFPDVLIVPLVGFDKNKFRLGYGGGFYDRYIAKLSNLQKVLTVGFAFSFQEVKNIPKNKYDKKLDFILTNKGIIK